MEPIRWTTNPTKDDAWPYASPAACRWRGGIFELAAKLIEAGSVESRAARYSVRALADTSQHEIPVEKAAQAIGGEPDQRRQ